MCVDFCGFFLGEMPVLEMLDEFLPKPKGRPPKIDFRDVPKGGKETDRYKPFVSAIVSCVMDIS